MSKLLLSKMKFLYLYYQPVGFEQQVGLHFASKTFKITQTGMSVLPKFMTSKHVAFIEDLLFQSQHYMYTKQDKTTSVSIIKKQHVLIQEKKCKDVLNQCCCFLLFSKNLFLLILSPLLQLLDMKDEMLKHQLPPTLLIKLATITGKVFRRQFHYYTQFAYL